MTYGISRLLLININDAYNGTGTKRDTLTDGSYCTSRDITTKQSGGEYTLLNYSIMKQRLNDNPALV
jgi:hypothetical protein